MSLYLDDQATVTVDVSMLNPVTGEGRVKMRAHPVVDDDVYEIVHALGEFNLVTKMERFLNDQMFQGFLSSGKVRARIVSLLRCQLHHQR